jgi:hypothetical protein
VIISAKEIRSPLFNFWIACQNGARVNEIPAGWGAKGRRGGRLHHPSVVSHRGNTEERDAIEQERRIPTFKSCCLRFSLLLLSVLSPSASTTGLSSSTCPWSHTMRC